MRMMVNQQTFNETDNNITRLYGKLLSDFQVIWQGRADIERAIAQHLIG